MARKLMNFEEVTWRNPLKDVTPIPYMGDEIWPNDPRDPRCEEAVFRMKTFYCSKRRPAQKNITDLKNYLACPEKYMIVWGDVGIGKSWFMRYELLAGENSMWANGRYHAGVIDMLSGEDTEYRVYIQLRHILETYFSRYCGSTRMALEAYSRFDIARLHGKDAVELSSAEENDAQIAVTKCLELRGYFTQEATISYVLHLLGTLQYLNRPELLILLIDNIDKTRDDEQESLVKLAVRLLRHPQIRLIITLRKSSRLLLDRFSVLKQFTYKEMELSPLDLREMIRLRFCRDRSGRSLSGRPIIWDDASKKKYTFPILFTMLFGENEKSISEAGNLLLTMAAKNAREALSLTERLIFSDQLKGLRNVRLPEYAVAALMLSDHSLPEPTSSCLINLFNDEEPELSGNNLIRFRLLEYFWNTHGATTSDVRFKQYFQCLGYDLERVKRVIELFIMTQLLVSQRGLSPDNIREMDLEDVGGLVITRSGLELKHLLNREWYFVSVKKDVYLPEWMIRQDTENEGLEYCTNTDFIEWLQEQEEYESYAIRKYSIVHGEMKFDWGLIRPHRIAAQALGVKLTGQVP